jgi:hypothetical protein
VSRRWSDPRREAEGPQFARNDNSRIYFTTGRGLQSITIDGYDRRTLVRVTGAGSGNNPPGADDIRLSPDGSRVFVNLQGRHHLVTVPRAGRETVEVRIQGRGDTTSRSSRCRSTVAIIWTGPRTERR